MSAEHTYDYAIIRVVPRVDRGELINAGVILSCPAVDFLEARIDLDAARLHALDPAVDVEAIRANLEIDPARLPRRRRRGADRRPAAAQPLPLAGVAAQHHHPDVPGSHRTDRRSGEGAAAPAGDDGAIEEQSPAKAGHYRYLTDRWWPPSGDCSA